MVNFWLKKTLRGLFLYLLDQSSLLNTSDSEFSPPRRPRCPVDPRRLPGKRSRTVCERGPVHRFPFNGTTEIRFSAKRQPWMKSDASHWSPYWKNASVRWIKLQMVEVLINHSHQYEHNHKNKRLHHDDAVIRGVSGFLSVPATPGHFNPVCSTL